MLPSVQYTVASVYWKLGLNWMGRYPGEPKMWEFNQTGNSLGVISKSSSQEAISLRSSRKHILNLLTVVMFVSFVYIKLWTGIGPKAGRETWYSYTSCRGYSNQPCHSLFLSNNTPRRCIHIQVCRIKRCQVLFGEYFLIFSSNNAHNWRASTQPQYSGLILVHIINHIQHCWQ